MSLDLVLIGVAIIALVVIVMFTIHNIEFHEDQD